MDTVRKWRGRFAVRGLDGLADLSRSGRPRRISELTRAAVVALACFAAKAAVILDLYQGFYQGTSGTPGGQINRFVGINGG